MVTGRGGPWKVELTNSLNHTQDYLELGTLKSGYEEEGFDGVGNTFAHSQFR